MTASEHRPSVTLHLRGGFANQLFQWAAVEYLRERHDFRLALDTRLIERPHDRGDQITKRGFRSDKRISPSKVERRLWRVLQRTLPTRVFVRLSAQTGRPRNFESELQRVDASLARGEDVRMFGYFQDIDIFRDRRALLQNTIGDALRGGGQSHPAGTYVHVRRGDYASVASNLAKFGLCSVDYYVGAADGSKVTVISDDPDWVQSNLLERLAPGSRIKRGGTLEEDFLDLVSAQELILSNSTFSWWAAFLGKASRIVAPVPWLESGDSSLVLSDWEARDKRTGEAL